MAPAGNLIKAMIISKNSSVNFYQKNIETMDRSEIEALQLKKLKDLVDYVSVSYTHLRAHET